MAESGGAFRPNADYNITGTWDFATPPTSGAGNTAVGTTATQTLTNKTLTSPVLTAPDINGGTVSAATVDGVLISGIGNGAAAGSGITASSEQYGNVHQTVLTLAIAGANKITIADGADNTVGKLLYTFPAGQIVILGAQVDADVTLVGTFNANPNDFIYLGVGQADGTQAANGDLTSTEQDVIAKTTIDTVGGTDLEHDFQVQMAATPVVIDGTTTAGKLYFNAAGLNANATTAVEVTVIGALRLIWVNVGDYTT